MVLAFLVRHERHEHSSEFLLEVQESIDRVCERMVLKTHILGARLGALESVHKVMYSALQTGNPRIRTVHCRRHGFSRRPWLRRWRLLSGMHKIVA